MNKKQNILTRITQLLLVVGLTALITACGQKGPLVLPEKAPTNKNSPA